MSGVYVIDGQMDPNFVPPSGSLNSQAAVANPAGSIRIWSCACGQLNYYPSDYEFSCTGCRFAKPIVDRVYLAVEVKR